MSKRHLPDDQSNITDSYLIIPVHQILAEQDAALQSLSGQLDSEQYRRALNLITSCKGHVTLSGVDRSGHIGRRMSATLAPTGTPSFPIHPAEAFHGDLDIITPHNFPTLIPANGGTGEVLKPVPPLKNFDSQITAITNNGSSALAKSADAMLELYMVDEVCLNNPAPTTSTTLTMMIGDTLVTIIIHQRESMSNDFVCYRPGGSLGHRLLTRIADIMQHDVSAVQSDASFKTVIQRITSGCQGMMMVGNTESGLADTITDSDLCRFMEEEGSLTSAMTAQTMIREPLTLPEDTIIIEVKEKMQKRRTSTLLVTDKTDRVTGFVCIFN